MKPKIVKLTVILVSFGLLALYWQSSLNQHTTAQAEYIQANPFILPTNDDEVEHNLINHTYPTSAPEDSFVPTQKIHPQPPLDHNATPEVQDKEEQKKVIPNSDHSIILDNSFGISCIPQHPKSVFYNRVPKTGSSTFRVITLRLMKNHNFTHFQSITFHAEADVPGALSEYRTSWTNAFSKFAHFLFDKHQYFIEPAMYSTFGLQPPSTHINILREPAARMLSYYDYMRWGPRPVKWKQELMKQPFANRTFEECVEAYRTNTNVAFVQDCMGFNEQMRFFCGIDPICYTDDPAALELAKKHLLENYMFVGLAEQYEETLLIAEKLLPDYFQGAFGIFANLPLERVNNAKKSHPSEEILEYWRSKNQLELQFYDFAKDLFQMRLQACNITFLGATEDNCFLKHFLPCIDS